ncbi:HAMP domain-containing sensor histidine kinase [Sphingomonas sp. MA1305]|uniref:HAMP domain-containing sensor histidine kinase n=1 Tax=Sphingomonas sp. MA1305 TaxID=2479204 RepID=UPI002FCD2E97
MRFDDSLKTVLSADMESGFGARSAWRQLVDLIGRGRAAPDEAALTRLRALREIVPVEIRAASGRALAFAMPPAPLVALFAEDGLAVAAPVLRTARLDASAWLDLLPKLNPEGRALLRHRRDLPREVIDGLAAYEAVDFVLPAAETTATATESQPAAEAEPLPDTVQPQGDASEQDVRPAPSVINMDAFRDAVPARSPAPAPATEPSAPDLSPAPHGGFRIADVVARIDAFQRQRDEAPIAEPAAELDAFRFETDAQGLVVAIDGGARGALIGVSLAVAMRQGSVTVDTAIVDAFLRRRRFSGARLDIAGRSELAGGWQVAGLPLFDKSGRFTGYLCTTQRPAGGDLNEGAERRRGSELLRQLVHELRTPTNAIAGFAELIESQLLGPVSDAYRGHALTIQAQAARLIGAIEDLDTAARIEGEALELHPEPVPIEPLLARVARDLSAFADAHNTAFDLHPMGGHAALTDSRAVERLLSRMLAALAGAAAPGERIDIAEAPADDGEVAICFARPAALAAIIDDDSLLSLGDHDGGSDGPLLGASFGLRLARDLARELGGGLSVGKHLLTLRLPAAVPALVGAPA